MKRYLKYLEYIVKHKWYVIKGGWLLFPWDLHLLYRTIIHDASKLSKMEFGPYARCFYGPNGEKQYDETSEFVYGWNHHQKCNKHHWQHWILKYDRGDSETLQMPDIYLREMLADWIGAGWIITGNKYNTLEFYAKNDTGRHLHPYTRHLVEFYLDKLQRIKDSEDQRIRILGY
jgi:hypothetical protein